MANREEKAMNFKRYVLAVLAVFAAFQLFDYLEHTLLLGAVYQAAEGIWRADMMSLMWVMILTSVLFSILFVTVFIKGYEGRGLMEGVRYGLLIGLLMNGVGMFNQWVVYPLPLMLVVQWFVCGMIRFVIYGMLAAAIYRPKKQSH